MKPTQEVIKLSKELWELGVRKGLKWGDWYLGKTEDLLLWVSVYMPPAWCLDGGHIPIWTSCDECIGWLKEKEYVLDTIELGVSFSGYHVTFLYLGDRPTIKVEAPTLIEALVLAMMEWKLRR